LSPGALRLLFLQAHYRSQMNFTWQSLQAAEKNLKDLQAAADLRFQANQGALSLSHDYFKKQQQAILEALSNDLSTPAAISRLESVSNKLLASGIQPESLEEFNRFLGFIDDLFGLDLSRSSDISNDQKDMISQRQLARSEDNWSRSDELRDRLAELGIDVSDTVYGTVWRRA
jgi:cysteinyl-tRNA synthetase